MIGQVLPNLVPLVWASMKEQLLLSIHVRLGAMRDLVLVPK